MPSEQHIISKEEYEYEQSLIEEAVERKERRDRFRYLDLEPTPEFKTADRIDQPVICPHCGEDKRKVGGIHAPGYCICTNCGAEITFKGYCPVCDTEYFRWAKVEYMTLEVWEDAEIQEDRATLEDFDEDLGLPCDGKKFTFPRENCAPPAGRNPEGLDCPECPVKTLKGVEQ